MEQVGCMYIVGHGIDKSIFDRLFSQTRQFFALPVETKKKLKSDSQMGRGYQEFETQNISAYNVRFL
jgi:isopenicillin N synthase-like dioxygenase